MQIIFVLFPFQVSKALRFCRSRPADVMLPRLCKYVSVSVTQFLQACNFTVIAADVEHELRTVTASVATRWILFIKYEITDLH
jgi:hypothetical protein